MKRLSCQFLVAISFALFCGVSPAATRPRTGGTLRVEMQARITSLDRGAASDAKQNEARSKLESLLFDHLVRLDRDNQPQPGLAISWESDAAFSQWRFKLRSGVKWHDGTAVSSGEVVAALQAASPRLHWRLNGDVIEISSDAPMPDLLIDLATSEDFVIQRPSTGATAGLPIATGPFRLTEWRPNERAAFQANDDYWGGRPYVDRIEIVMGRPSHDTLLDLELGRADLAQLDPGEARRAQLEGRRVWTSAPADLLMLRFSSDAPRAQDSRLREAIARSIDRTAIQKVLLQNYGEIAGSLFPQWLSGYAFLFPVAVDLDRARQLKAEIGSPPPLKLGYDAADLLARQIAERVAVNARDAGFSLQVAALPNGRSSSADPSSDLILVRRRVAGPTLQSAARQFNSWLPFWDGRDDNAKSVYDAEKHLLESFAVVPIVCVPEIIGLGPRLRDWNATRADEWQLDEVWLEAEKP